MTQQLADRIYAIDLLVKASLDLHAKDPQPGLEPVLLCLVRAVLCVAEAVGERKS